MSEDRLLQQSSKLATKPTINDEDSLKSSVDGRLRNFILHDHLDKVVLNQPRSLASNISSGLTYERAISLLDVNDDDEVENASKNEITQCLPGALVEDDIKRFSFTPLRIDARTQTLLLAELKKTLRTVVELWYADEENIIPDERNALAKTLPETIVNQHAEIEDGRAKIKSLHLRIQNLIHEIKEVHPRLNQSLLAALESIPPLLDAERSAKSDVLALTIETCLLKLSLLRAKTYSSIYGHSSSITSRPKQSQTTGTSNEGQSKEEKTMLNAIAVLHARFSEKEAEQEKEERKLDKEIGEYEKLLALVDGGGRRGGFSQVVDDMAKVRKEIDECRKDLRRLGWTDT
ncbi:hypothetical protein ABKN59_010506 [Abortiporus biennis]